MVSQETSRGRRKQVGIEPNETADSSRLRPARSRRERGLVPAGLDGVGLTGTELRDSSGTARWDVHSLGTRRFSSSNS